MSEATQNPPDQPGPESGSETPLAPESQGQVLLDKLAETQNEFSAEDIDQFLQAEDPAFAGQLQEMKGDNALSMVEAEIDADTAALHDEIERWRNSRGLRRVLYMAFPVLPRVSLAVKKVWLRLQIWLRAIRLHMQNFAYYLITEGRKSAQTWLKEKISGFFGKIGDFFSDLRLLSAKLKLALFGMVLLIIGSVAVLFLAWKGKLLPQDKELFIINLADHATQVYEVDEEEGFENFYDNVRSTPNLLLIQKLVINIKRSQNSGPNPMAAGEFFAEGLNPDVIIEVKDREAFFRDLIQREAEDFSFDELSSTEGKRRLTQVLLRSINRNLTTGELRNIRIKTLILKP